MHWDLCMIEKSYGLFPPQVNCQKRKFEDIISNM